jgi:hypothetical protein
MLMIRITVPFGKDGHKETIDRSDHYSGIYTRRYQFKKQFRQNLLFKNLLLRHNPEGLTLRNVPIRLPRTYRYEPISQIDQNSIQNVSLS